MISGIAVVALTVRKDKKRKVCDERSEQKKTLSKTLTGTKQKTNTMNKHYSYVEEKRVKKVPQWYRGLHKNKNYEQTLTLYFWKRGSHQVYGDPCFWFRKRIKIFLK